MIFLPLSHLLFTTSSGFNRLCACASASGCFRELSSSLDANKWDTGIARKQRQELHHCPSEQVQPLPK